MVETFFGLDRSFLNVPHNAWEPGFVWLLYAVSTDHL